MTTPTVPFKGVSNTAFFRIIAIIGVLALVGIFIAVAGPGLIRGGQATSTAVQEGASAVQDDASKLTRPAQYKNLLVGDPSIAAYLSSVSATDISYEVKEYVIFEPKSDGVKEDMANGYVGYTDTSGTRHQLKVLLNQGADGNFVVAMYAGLDGIESVKLR